MPGVAGMSNEQLLAILTDTINALRKRAGEDIIEIGCRLIEAKAIAGHGNWLPWLEREFGWTDKTAENYMNVFRLLHRFEKSVTILEDFHKEYYNMPVWDGVSHAIRMKLKALGRHPEDPPPFGLAEAVAVLIEQYGFDAVSDEVLEHNL
jgi:DUF3102 family protein